MNGCNDCAHAVWKRTANGRLHPDRSGRCGFVWSPPPMPMAFSFSYLKAGQLPIPNGGFIERGKYQYTDCECFNPKG